MNLYYVAGVGHYSEHAVIAARNEEEAKVIFEYDVASIELIGTSNRTEPSVVLWSSP